jgi:hypothetical protein
VSLAFCWSHVRRRFYELAVGGASPIASEALQRIAALYRNENDIRGRAPDERRDVRRARTRPLIADLEPWLREKLGLISQKSKLAEAIRYALTRWEGLTRFLDDGQIEIDSNTVERSIRPIALNRKNALFAGSDEGASYCSSRHPLKSQRDFFGNSQTAAVATAERSLRAERSRAPARHGGLSKARPCTAGSRKVLFRRSIDARLRY